MTDQTVVQQVAQQVSETAVAVKDAVEQTAKAVVKPERQGTIVLAGFWGRGNAGDEAMLQCITETLGDRFDYALSVSEHGAREGFWDWYPYKGRTIVNQGDADIFGRIKKPLGIIVGGGGLPIGFAGGQVIAARSRGLKTVMAGVDIWRTREAESPMAQEMRRYLGAMDAVYGRTANSVENGVKAGCGDIVRLGADWALNLPTDRSPEVVDQPGRALVVLREDNREALPENYKEQILSLLASISAAGKVPFFLPFSPEDDRFIDTMGLRGAAPTENTWWNARRLKQLIASSGMTVSVGRLHPLIFGAPTGRPVICINMERRDGGLRSLKLDYMCEDLGVPLYHTIQAFQADMPNATRPADAKRIAASKARLNAQADHLRRVFTGQVESGKDKSAIQIVTSTAETPTRMSTARGLFDKLGLPGLRGRSPAATDQVAAG